jgi:hypothetical protein
MSLAAGVSLFSLARRMGTSVEMIDRTYGHLAADAEEYERGLLDAYDGGSQNARGSYGSLEGGAVAGAVAGCAAPSSSPARSRK